MRKRLVFLFCTCFIGISFASTAPEKVFNTTQTQAIQTIVHNYLIQNPQILLEMSRTLQAQREQEVRKMEEETKSLLGKYTKELLDTQNHVAIGNHRGDVIITEIFDYQCLHCKPMSSVVNKLVTEDPNLEVIFIEWPIYGTISLDGIRAALAARKQGKYMELHNALLAFVEPLSLAHVQRIAKSVGLNEQQLQRDMADKAVATIIENNTQLAKNLKLVATPAFIISDRQGKKFRFVLGQVGAEELHKAISEIRAK